MKKMMISAVLLSGILCVGGCSRDTETTNITSDSNPPAGLTQSTSPQDEKVQKPTDKKEKKSNAKESYKVSETDLEKQVSYWRTMESTINIRQLPDIDSKSIAIGSKDQDLQYLHTKYRDPSDQRIWYKIKVSNGQIGWVSSKVVAQSDGQNFKEMPKLTAQNSQQTNDNLRTSQQSNIRQQPSINSSSIAIVKADTILNDLHETVYDHSDGRTWYKVSTNAGTVGWISGKVLQKSSSFNLAVYEGEWTLNDLQMNSGQIDGTVTRLVISRVNNNTATVELSEDRVMGGTVDKSVEVESTIMVDDQGRASFNYSDDGVGHFGGVQLLFDHTGITLNISVKEDPYMRAGNWSLPDGKVFLPYNVKDTGSAY
ncbi:SH3 domain-containing protein [Paenibacillus shenyangensis]|uniref:SH3 domain-containing protein n=1 Tax=Paenibacillus sp. A9 TaxID=1284352 RepID=UPI00036F9C89|nr:SH3 domain-containing protein [Paenibacillus sp. A9]